jgi:hypothetical protein
MLFLKWCREKTPPHVMPTIEAATRKLYDPMTDLKLPNATGKSLSNVDLRANSPVLEQGAQFNRAAFSEELMVSNVGRVPFNPDFGKGRIESLWAPVILRGHDPEQTIGVSTINGSLHLVHTSWTPIPGPLGAHRGETRRALPARFGRGRAAWTGRCKDGHPFPVPLKDVSPSSPVFVEKARS